MPARHLSKQRLELPKMGTQLLQKGGCLVWMSLALNSSSNLYSAYRLFLCITIAATLQTVLGRGVSKRCQSP